MSRRPRAETWTFATLYDTIRYDHMQQNPQCFVGIDISKDHLDACCRRHGRSRRRRLRNTPKGQRALVSWIGTVPARACLEASGRYSIDVTVALVEADRVEVMVANPRAVKNFREASMRKAIP